MIKTISSRTYAFDSEWVPCAATERRLLGLLADNDDCTAMEAVWTHYRDADDAPESRPFLKLALSQVVSIAGVMREMDPDRTIHLHLGVRTLAHGPEGELSQRFLEKVAADRYLLWGCNSRLADPAAAHHRPRRALLEVLEASRPRRLGLPRQVARRALGHPATDRRPRFRRKQTQAS